MSINQLHAPLLELSPDCLLTLRPQLDSAGNVTDLTVLYANTAVRALLGSNHPDPNGESLPTLVPGLADSSWFRQVKSLIETQSTSTFQDYIPCGDNSPLGETTVLPADGFVYIRVRNISGEIQNETLLSASPVTLWMSDTQGNILHLNRTWMDWTGRPYEEHLGHGWTMSILEEDRPRAAETFLNDLVARRPYEVDFRIRRADGRVRWCLATGMPYYNQDGQFAGYAGSCVDITERKKAEEKLRLSEAQLHRLADSMPQLVWTTDPQGTTDYWNQRWFDYTGLPRDGDITRWLDVIHPDDQQRTVHAWNHAVANGKPYQIQYRLRKGLHSDEYRWFLGLGVPVWNEDGTIYRWFGTCTDIDDQKNAEQRLERMVEERTQTLREANEVLQRSNGYLRQFTHITSHDLKEPLRKIQSFGDILIQEYSYSLGETGVDLLNRMRRAAARMTELIDGLLQFARMSDSIPVFRPVALEVVMKQTLEDLEYTIQSTGARIMANSLPTLSCDPLQIGQLFSNLLSNAIKFRRKDMPAQVTVTALPYFAPLEPDSEVAVRWWELRFQDNGIGFETRFKDRIFNLFQRLHTAEGYTGAGLGFSICQRIVENHHGSIDVESSLGQGATFIIRLPESQRIQRYEPVLTEESSSSPNNPDN